MTPRRTPLAIVSMLLVAHATAQTAQVTGSVNGFLDMAVRVPESSSLPTTDPDPPIATWRSFVALEEMRLQLQFSNESQTTLWMYRGELRNNIQFRVDAEQALPVTVRWLDEMI